MVRTLVAYIAILFLLVPVASAGLTDTASRAVADGFRTFVEDIADQIFSITIAGYEKTDEDTALTAIYNIATWTPDPMKFDAVQKLISWSKSVFKPIYSAILLGALSCLFVVYYKPDTADSIQRLTGVDVGTGLHKYAEKALQGVLVAGFVYVLVYFVLALNDALSKSVMLTTLDAIAPTPDNFVLYFIMALAYLGMSLFFALRILVIFLFTSFALLVGLCFLIDNLRDTATNLTLYFIQTVFFQFVIVLYFGAAIVIIQALDVPGQFENLLYIAMLFLGVWIGLKMMIGTAVIKTVSKIALKVI